MSLYSESTPPGGGCPIAKTKTKTRKATGRRNRQTPAEFLALGTSRAEVLVQRLRRGGRIAVLTKGQFSLLDLIRAVLEKTGPADVRLTTWSAGIRDIEAAAWLLETDVIRSLRIYMDRSFAGRQPRYAARLTQLFGADCIRISSVHAKIALIENDGWSVVIRSSMNLNRNRRFEQADLDDDPAMARWYGRWLDELDADVPVGLYGSSAEVTESFNGLLSVSDDEALAEITGLQHPTRDVEVPPTAPPTAAAPQLDLSGGDVGELEMARYLLDRARFGLESSQPGSVAYTHNLREVRTAHAALMDLQRAAEQAQEVEITPEQWSAMVYEDAMACTDDDIEIYVRVWLQRQRHELYRDGDDIAIRRSPL